MIQAGIGTQREHALASLLALNGLRVFEALNADMEDWIATPQTEP